MLGTYLVHVPFMQLHTVLVRKVEMQLDGGSADSSADLWQRALKNGRIGDGPMPQPEHRGDPRPAGRALRMKVRSRQQLFGRVDQDR